MAAKRGVWPPQEQIPGKICEQIVDVHVPQVLEVPKTSSRDRISRGTVEQIPDVPVQKTVEVSQVQFLGKAVDMPVGMQRQVPMAQTVRKTMEVPPLQFTDKATEETRVAYAKKDNDRRERCGHDPPFPFELDTGFSCLPSLRSLRIQTRRAR